MMPFYGWMICGFFLGFLTGVSIECNQPLTEWAISEGQKGAE